MEEKRKTIALALSGGGNRGAVHVGILHAFDSLGIKIDAISGTSAGAIIGSLYCSGLSGSDIRDIFDKQKANKLLHFTFKNTGIANMANLVTVLENNISKNDYKALKTKLFVCASNIDNDQFEILEDGDLFAHVCASASIPILFEPVLINGMYYVDGGLFNNLPADPLFGNYDIVIGVHVNNYKVLGKFNTKSIANRIFSMVIRQNIKQNAKKCDFFINPELDQPYRRFSKNNTEKLFDIGYKEGVKFIEDNLL